MSIDQLCLLAKTDPEIPDSFSDWLRDNEELYLRFEREALKVARNGRHHYSAYTIREFIRHETMLAEKDSEFKISNNVTPSLARLFRLRNPQWCELFTYKPIRQGCPHE